MTDRANDDWLDAKVSVPGLAHGRLWIAGANQAGIHEVAEALGLEVGSYGSIRPCPICQRVHRGRTDKRGPISVYRDRRKDGHWRWTCIPCRDVSGDVVDLVSYQLHHRRLRELDPKERRTVRAWFNDRGQL